LWIIVCGRGKRDRAVVAEGIDHNPPLVAVITRTRNRPLLLGRALDSVLGQSLGNWIHVIVNDGGDRDPVERLVAERAKRYDGRVRIIHNATSIGMEAASNAGIAASQSRYLAIHDDDDAWRPEFLARSIAALGEAHAACKGVISRVEEILERIEGDRIIEIKRRNMSRHIEQVELWHMLAANIFQPISFVFERAAYEKVGPFDAGLPVLGDWDFNLRFMREYDIAVIKEELACYHLRQQSDEDDYSNTVTARLAEHMKYRAIIVNRLLREDIRSGRIGVGSLAAIAGQTYSTELALKQLFTGMRRQVARSRYGLVGLVVENAYDGIRAILRLLLQRRP
jgi:glycosyltransferase involved in cell wall biosynthesis